MFLSIVFDSRQRYEGDPHGGDSDVILSTVVTAAMSAVFSVTALRRRKVTYSCEQLCVELHAYIIPHKSKYTVSITYDNQIYRFTH